MANYDSGTLSVLLGAVSAPSVADPAPLLAIADVATRAGRSETTTPASLTVSLSAPSGQAVTVSYGTADGTAISETGYQAASGDLTLAPGAVTASLTVLVLRPR